MSDSFTTRQVSELLGQPEWRIRRAVDSMNGIGRFGGKRVIPSTALPKIIDILRGRGWLPIETEAAK